MEKGISQKPRATEQQAWPPDIWPLNQWGLYYVGIYSGSRLTGQSKKWSNQINKDGRCWRLRRLLLIDSHQATPPGSSETTHHPNCWQSSLSHPWKKGHWGQRQMDCQLDPRPLKTKTDQTTNPGNTIPISSKPGHGNSAKLGMEHLLEVDLCCLLSFSGVEQYGSRGRTGVSKLGSREDNRKGHQELKFYPFSIKILCILCKGQSTCIMS